METTIIDFSQLSDLEILELVNALKSNSFEITKYTPSTQNHPEGLLDIYINNYVYCYLLDDQDASFSYLAIKFKGRLGKNVLLPVGAFGISSGNSVHYPLIASGYLKSFLDISIQDLEAITEIDTEILHAIYNDLITIRLDLMRKIFLYYATVDVSKDSFAAWKLRDKESATRKAAEAVFKRVPYPENKVEFYHSKEIGADKNDYLKHCYQRWERLEKVFDNVFAETPKYQNQSQNMENFSKMFYSGLALTNV